MVAAHDLVPAEHAPDRWQENAGGLLDDKAWAHLGLTGQEFRRRWYAGLYRDDTRPAVLALDRLMRTGTWSLES